MRSFFILSILASLLFSGCGDYLDMVPEKDIETVETIFERRRSAENWLIGVYASVAPPMTDFSTNPIFLGTDEVVMCELLRNASANGIVQYPGSKVAQGLQMSQSPYGNIWDKGALADRGGEYCSMYENIRNCNVFLDNIDNVYDMEDAEKEQWKGEVLALKAYCYFELIRRYGPIVLVPKNISVDADKSQTYQSRVHVDTCFKAVVDLLDEAAEYLLPSDARTYDRSAYFSKDAALALKAKVLLYAASPLFNGNEFYADFKGKNGEPLFGTEPDPEKWRLAAEAADEAVKFCEDHGHILTSGSAGKGSKLLNTMYDIEFSVHSDFDNPEFILEWKFAHLSSHYLPLLPTNLNHVNYDATGSLNPSLKMVEMFYTENGLPLEADNTWGYEQRYKQGGMETNAKYTDVVPLNSSTEKILHLHLRREPRFYANIAADRTYWKRGPKGNPRVDNNLLVRAYRNEEFGTSENVVSSRKFQNVNGYWMKKFTYSDLQTKSYYLSEETFPVIRLAELYLMQAEAWNEYEGPSAEKVYKPLNKVRERAGIFDVETSWRSYSNSPEKIMTREGMRDIIRQEINIEFAFEGHRFFNLRRWKTAHEELNEHPMGWNIIGENFEAFYNYGNGPIEVETVRKFTAPRDYLFPLRAEDVLISGLQQNPGW